MFTPEQESALNAPLSRESVKTRSQANRTLSYIEGWHAIAEANRIFGFGGWSRETVHLKEVARYDYSGKHKVGFEAKVRVTIGGVTREGTGYGSGIMTDLFDAMESAGKEAETDAMKRALMTFGNPFGLALYDKTQANVSDPAEIERQRELEQDRAVYAANFRQTLLNATKPDDIRSLWRTDTQVRDDLGISVSHPLHSELHAAWEARGKKLSSQAKEAA